MKQTTSNSEYVEKLKENTEGNIKIVSSKGGIWIELESMSSLEIPDIPNWYVDEIENKGDFVWVFFKFVK
jgi:hypothetical protein